MATERKFLLTSIGNLKVKAFLREELKRAGISSISIQRTPLVTRIKMDVMRPGMVVGRKGTSVTSVADLLREKFGIENPQLDIARVDIPEMDAQLMAEKIGTQIEVKGNIKQIMRFVLKDIMNAGAIGAEIRVAGKLVGKGGKAKSLAIRDGYLKKSGHAMKQVKVGHYVSYLKAGAIGITVKIVPKGTIFADQIKPPAMPAVDAGTPQNTTVEGDVVSSDLEKAAVEKVVAEKMAEAKAVSESTEKAKVDAVAKEKKARAPRKKKEDAKLEEKAAEKPVEPQAPTQ